MRNRAEPWGRLAAVTGLRCQIGGLLVGYPVRVEGNYRGRPLALYTSTTGKGLIQSTCLDLKISLPTSVILRMRGPYELDEIVVDKVTKELLNEADVRESASLRFFMRRHPPETADRIFADRELGHLLEGLPTLVSIDLCDSKPRL